MAAKFKIAILGLGGVGGYVGGKLAARYSYTSDIEVAFIARGENGMAIHANGLKLITTDGEQIVHPNVITSEPGHLGILDLVICCVKNYDLGKSIETLRPCIGRETVILPFLNGVDAAERIKKVFPEAEVWEGCVYIVSRLIAPGVVKAGENPNKFYFGSGQGKNGKLKHVETIFKGAGINVDLSEDISQTIWEKFLFISTIATLTSFLNRSIGEILRNPDYTSLLMNLLNELKAVADAKGLFLSDAIIEKMVRRMFTLPYETTSSMHDDFLKEGKTELYSLTGFVVEQGKQLNIPTPTYEKMFETLASRSKTGVWHDL